MSKKINMLIHSIIPPNFSTLLGSYATSQVLCIEFFGSVPAFSKTLSGSFLVLTAEHLESSVLSPECYIQLVYHSCSTAKNDGIFSATNIWSFQKKYSDTFFVFKFIVNTLVE